MCMRVYVCVFILLTLMTATLGVLAGEGGVDVKNDRIQRTTVVLWRRRRHVFGGMSDIHIGGETSLMSGV